MEALYSIEGARSWSRLAGRIEGRRVLVRSDLNRPFEARLEAELPTYRFVLNNNGRLWVMSHCGRYGEDAESLEYARRPIAEALGCEVLFFDDYRTAAGAKLGKGEVGLLENTRMSPEDEANDDGYAGLLAEVGDVIILNGASVCHRNQASVTGILKHKPGFAGLLVESEYVKIRKFSGKPEGCAIAGVGGAKLKEKMKLLGHAANNGYVAVPGGLPLNNMLLAKGYNVGKSKTEEDGKNYVDEAQKILADSEQQIRLPDNVVCVLGDFSDPLEFPVDHIPDDRMVVDIVPGYFDDDMARARAALLVGPLGVYEKGHTAGTNSFVNQMPKNSLIFGADTAKAMRGVAYRGEISLGGGAGVELLLTGDWVAVQALRENAKNFDFP